MTDLLASTIRRTRLNAAALVAILIGFGVLLALGQSAGAATDPTNVTLQGGPDLATIPCTIDVVRGQTYDDFTLNPCVTGGSGARTYGPAPAPGDNPQISPDGSYTYTAPTQTGQTSFDFTVSDQFVGPVPGEVTVVVHDPLVAPDTTITVIRGQTAQLDLDALVTGGFGDRDFDAPAAGDQGGAITVDANGLLSYTPPATGSADTFDYTVLDDSVETALSGTVTVVILDQLAIAPCTFNADPGETITGSLEACITGGDGSPVFGPVGTAATPNGGSVTIAADGSFSYTAPNTPGGDDTIPFTVDDTTIAAPLAGEADIHIVDPLVVIPCSFEAAPGETITGSLTDCLSGGEGTPVFGPVGTTATTGGGSVTINVDGSFSYTAPDGPSGTDTIDFTVEDDTTDAPLAGEADIAIIDPLVVEPCSFTADPGETITGSLTDCISGGLGTPVFGPVGTTTTAGGGSVTISADGSFSYTAPNTPGADDTIPFTVDDDSTDAPLSGDADVHIVDPLTIEPCSFEAAPGETITGSLADCVSGGEGTPVFGPVGTSTTPGGGSVTINADGSFSYTAPATPGTDTIPFTVEDDTTDAPLSGEADVAIFDPLAIGPCSFVADPGETITGSLVDCVSGGLGELTFGPVGTSTTPNGGSVTIAADGSFTYTAPNTPGADDTIPFTVSDESTDGPLSGDADVHIVDPLTIEPCTFSADPGETITGTLSECISGGEGTPVFGPVGTTTTVGGGSVTIAADGSFTYTAPNTPGGSDTIDFTVEDDTTDAPLNGEADIEIVDPLVIEPCTFEANPGETITGSLADCVSGGEGEPTFGPVGTSTTPGGGSVTINPDGTFTYTAPNTPGGSDSIPFTVEDETTDEPLSGEAEIEIVNPLTVVPCTFQAAPGETITGTLADCISGGDGEPVFGPTGTTTTPGGGTITINPDGTFTYTAPSTPGTDTIPFTVEDDTTDEPLTGEATVEVVEPLEIVDCTFDVGPGETITGSLTDCVTGGEGDRVFGPVGTSTTPNGGSVTIAADGSFSYTAPNTPGGSDTIPFTVDDDTTDEPLSGDADIQIADPLVVEPCTFTAAPGETITGTLTDCISGGEGEPVFGPPGTTTTPGGGTITINPDGTFTYTAPSTPGTDTIPFTVEDSTTDEPLTGEVVIVVTAPLAVKPCTFQADPLKTITGSLMDCVEGGVGQLIFGPGGAHATPNGGTVTINRDGTFTYTAPDRPGQTDAIDFTVRDDVTTSPLIGSALVEIDDDGDVDPVDEEPTPSPSPNPGPGGGQPPVTGLPNTGAGPQSAPVSLAWLLTLIGLLLAGAGYGVRTIVRERR